MVFHPPKQLKLYLINRTTLNYFPHLRLEQSSLVKTNCYFKQKNLIFSQGVITAHENSTNHVSLQAGGKIFFSSFRYICGFFWQEICRKYWHRGIYRSMENYPLHFQNFCAGFILYLFIVQRFIIQLHFVGYN